MVSAKPVSNETKIKRQSLLRKVLGQCAIWIFLILMYVPILVLIASSFTDTEIIGQWGRFRFEL